MDVFITPSTRSDQKKLLATYNTWKNVSKALHVHGNEALHLQIERKLMGKRNSLSVSLTFNPQDAQTVLSASRET